MSIWLDTVTVPEVADAFLSGAQGFISGDKTADQVMAGVQSASAAAKKESQMSERTLVAEEGSLGLGRYASRRKDRPAARRTGRRWRALIWVFPGLAVLMVFVYYPCLL